MRRWCAGVAVAALGMALWVSQARGQQSLDWVELRPSAPADNPATPAKTALGRLLFWDPILSGPKDVACATCHHPEFGYADGLGLSIGVNGSGVGSQRVFVPGAPAHFAKRNSQSILNTAFNGFLPPGTYSPALAPMFWDMRTSGLEAQALEPIKSAEEMRGHAYPEDAAIDTVVSRLRAIPAYVALFDDAFVGGSAAVTAPNLARAIAVFERSLVAVNSPFDRFKRGDRTALTPLQVAGMQAFERIGCVRCHSGPMFSDFKTHVLGVPDNAASPDADGGIQGTNAFRTPTLRNLAATGPYMHSGVFATLGEVVRFYNRVGRGRRGGRGGGDRRAGFTDRRGVELDPLLRELRGVGRSRDELTAFLAALNDDGFDRTVPPRVPSGLRPGGRVE